ncbi:hypothetical protein [Edaphobacter albus]|uniref:hypothetical protein n=1 Tax=Edaphobacter sp. 4G125 TaxID=2763071 RepID=UPI001646DC28|nr:hypothetical protein [Edaphobacter sp. 4G125]QNI36450.1 hypothetical protein H7846_16030 [Edaphobacter sp. 4G125]
MREATFKTLAFLFCGSAFFDGNVTKFRGIKDFSTHLTFDELGVFIAGDDLNNGVFALDSHKANWKWDELVGFCFYP